METRKPLARKFQKLLLLREERLEATRRRIDEWASAPSPPRDDEPNLAAQFPRYEG